MTVVEALEYAFDTVQYTEVEEEFLDEHDEAIKILRQLIEEFQEEK